MCYSLLIIKAYCIQATVQLINGKICKTNIKAKVSLSIYIVRMIEYEISSKWIGYLKNGARVFGCYFFVKNTPFSQK